MSDSRGKRGIPAKGISHMEKIADVLDIPKEFLAGTLKVSVIGNNELTAEGRFSVLEYTDTFLSIASAGFVFTVSGENLELTILDSDFMTLKGLFRSISYIS